MKVLHFFEATKAQVQEYDLAYHGPWYARLGHRFGETERSRESICRLLTETIEGSLIEFFQKRLGHLDDENKIHVMLSPDNENELVQAFMLRLPQISAESKLSIALSLLKELKKALSDETVLLVDGGQVSIRGGYLVVRVNRGV